MEEVYKLLKTLGFQKGSALNKAFKSLAKSEDENFGEEVMSLLVSKFVIVEINNFDGLPEAGEFCEIVNKALSKKAVFFEFSDATDSICFYKNEEDIEKLAKNRLSKFTKNYSLGSSEESLARNVLDQIEEVAKSGLNHVYRNHKDFLIDLTMDLPWKQDDRQRALKFLLDPAQLGSKLKKISDLIYDRGGPSYFEYFKWESEQGSNDSDSNEWKNGRWLTKF